MLAGITFGLVYDHIFFGNLIPLETVQVSVVVAVVVAAAAAVGDVPYELPYVVAGVVVVLAGLYVVAVVVVVIDADGDETVGLLLA